jgi:ribosomal-protein-alanine N-acetyltransferase
MRVRKFALSDLADVVRIERASFGQEAYSVTTFLAHIFRDRKGLFVVEDEDGRPAGYVVVRLGLRWLGVRRGGITSIAVGPSQRRRGFGRALMAAALTHLKTHGVDEADLEVNVVNRAAQSLYEAFGFVQSRLLPHYYGPGGDGVRMVLDCRRSAVVEGSAQVTRAERGAGG